MGIVKKVELFLAILLLFSMPKVMAATPLMNLSLPSPGVTLGPTWATMLNTALTSVDSHNHTTGHGAKIPTASLLINADLSLGNYSLTNANALRLLSQTGTLSGSADVRSVYSVNGDLYWNNSSGTAVKITSGSGLNIASLGVIGGDYGGTNPAAVTYSNTTKTYAFTQSTGMTASMAMGPVTIFENAVGAKGVTLQSPTSLGSNLTFTLPGTSAVDNSVMKINGSNQMSHGQVQTAEIADDAIITQKILNSNVTTAKIADLNVTTAKIADGAITQAKRVSLGQQVSDSSGAFADNSGFVVDVTNLSVTITTTGRPVMIFMQSDGSGNASELYCVSVGYLKLLRGSTEVARQTVANPANPSAHGHPIMILDTPPAGTYTYKVQGYTPYYSITVKYFKLVAYEL